ncbi:MAG: hypothetical protein HY942_02650 [Gammaproteobacteria bacterium]|nr:hypothetical protein [Gammaproteobacteria bacterium]
MLQKRWLQIRGDPSVRQFVFDQERIASEFDAHLDEVLMHVETLILKHGVFHAKVHFSSGQVTLWLLQDPLRYRVHIKEEFLDPNLCLAYPCVAYTQMAVVPTTVIPLVLAEFKRLRGMDPQMYLRSGSLNVINGLVGLNFSCDGSHYLGYAEFLDRARELYV